MEITLEVGQVYGVHTILDMPRLLVYAGESVGGIKQKNALWFCIANDYKTSNEYFFLINIQDITHVEHLGRMRKRYEFWYTRVVLFANQ
jgi:hypothetical protein